MTYPLDEKEFLIVRLKIEKLLFEMLEAGWDINRIHFAVTRASQSVLKKLYSFVRYGSQDENMKGLPVLSSLGEIANLTGYCEDSIIYHLGKHYSQNWWRQKKRAEQRQKKAR